jgi:HAD superfamily hydrolase (TIGR01509 family)
LLTNFDVALSSHELGRVKPDAECFVAALEHLEVDAQDVAFFDDSPANVAAASAQGMRAFRVNGADEAKATLQAEGWIA